MSFTDPNLYSASAVRTMDRMAVEALQISSLDLMRRAGAAAYQQLREQFPKARRFAVVCGGGNNAGDGYVIARLLLDANYQVDLFALTPPSQLPADAATCASEFLDHPRSGLHASIDLATDCDLIVDALLGTGLSRDVSGEYRRAVDAINQHVAPVLSLDIPSGIDSDTGRIMGTACQASLTVCFIAWKAGLFLAEGRDRTGLPVLEKLGVDESIRSAQTPLLKVLHRQAPFGLRPRPTDCHKGSFGHAVLLGGNYGMPGAIRLAAEACLNAGAGVVSVITRPEHAAQLASAVPELMCLGASEGADVRDLLQRASVVGIGPGLGQDAWAEALFHEVCAVQKPVVADADALTLLGRFKDRHANWVLTPHPGEAGRLLSCSTRQIQADRTKAATAIHKTFAATVVLKGRGTLVASDALTRLSLGGTPAMAAPGMGDVLCGLITGLLAQGLSRSEAAEIGVQVHNCAAERAAQGHSRGMRASAVIREIPACVN